MRGPGRRGFQNPPRPEPRGETKMTKVFVGYVLRQQEEVNPPSVRVFSSEEAAVAWVAARVRKIVGPQFDSTKNENEEGAGWSCNRGFDGGGPVTFALAVTCDSIWAYEAEDALFPGFNGVNALVYTCEVDGPGYETGGPWDN